MSLRGFFEFERIFFRTVAANLSGKQVLRKKRAVCLIFYHLKALVFTPKSKFLWSSSLKYGLNMESVFMFSNQWTQGSSLHHHIQGKRDTVIFKGGIEILSKSGKKLHKWPLKHLLSKSLNDASTDLFFKNSCQLLLLTTVGVHWTNTVACVKVIQTLSSGTGLF